MCFPISGVGVVKAWPTNVWPQNVRGHMLSQKLHSDYVTQKQSLITTSQGSLVVSVFLSIQGNEDCSSRLCFPKEAFFPITGVFRLLWLIYIAGDVLWYKLGSRIPNPIAALYHAEHVYRNPSLSPYPSPSPAM